jgi:diguanylate cyclase (GGDEF)-like protein/PAS domain S-box-containing protein
MVALLAFQPGIEAGFDPLLTFLSLVLGIVGIGAGLVMAVGRHSRARRFVAGLMLGLGVGVLHYVGQASYVVRGDIDWDFYLVAASLLVSLPIFGLALVAAGERKRALRPLAAPLLLMSIAILHLGGMAALSLTFDPRILLPSRSVPPEVLAPVVAAVCFGLLALAVVGLRFSLDARARLRRDHQRLRELADLAVEGLVICHGETIASVNESFERVSGLSQASLVGKSLTGLLPGLVMADFPQYEERDARLVGSDGHFLPVRVVRRDVQVGDQTVTVIAIRDQRERIASEAKIKTLAFFDPLTGLANRSRFTEVLSDLVTDSQATGRPFSVLLFDLDGFKAVNDALGHAGGDAVLRSVSQRLLTALDAGTFVSRLGGDEFAVLLPGTADPIRASIIGKRIVATIEEPLEVNHRTVWISAGVGISLSDERKASAEQIVIDADLALYAAKAEGRGRVRLFTRELRHAAIERSSTAQELLEAWESKDFELYYQPQVRLSDGCLVGAEALIRWNYPYRGVVSPAAFLPVLECSHLAAPVGEWILRTACRQAVEWRARGHAQFRMGVNLFAAQFRVEGFAASVQAILEEYGLPPAGLELEVTENIILKDEGHIVEQLECLRAAGVGVAFDDFGTGYASLTMLKLFPVTRLKIDRSFVRNIEASRQDQAIVEAIARMADGFDLQIIAEGIEEVGQADFMRNIASEGQGYLFGKPMTVAAFESAFGLSSSSQKAA